MGFGIVSSRFNESFWSPDYVYVFEYAWSGTSFGYFDRRTSETDEKIKVEEHQLFIVSHSKSILNPIALAILDVLCVAEILSRLLSMLVIVFILSQ